MCKVNMLFFNANIFNSLDKGSPTYMTIQTLYTLFMTYFCVSFIIKDVNL